MLENDEWKNEAACKGLPLSDFFPVRISKDNSAKVKELILLCESCPVNAECLYDAVWNDSVGIWGRTTYRQRRSFVTKVLKGKRSNITLLKCKNLIQHLTDNKIMPTQKAYKADSQN